VRVKLQSAGGFGGARVTADEEDEEDEPAAKPARKTTRR
jgi:ribosome-associated protein